MRRGKRERPGCRVTGGPRRGRHAHHASYALTARRVALLAAGTAAGIVAAVVIAAVLAALCAVFLTGTAILLAAIRIPPKWLLWAGLIGSWPAAELFQGARVLPAGHMPLIEAVAVMVAGCAGGLTALTAARRRRWRQTAGRAGNAPGGRRIREAVLDGRIASNADRLDALERSHTAMANKQAAFMEAVARTLRGAGVTVPADPQAKAEDDGGPPALRCLSGGRSASLPGWAA